MRYPDAVAGVKVSSGDWSNQRALIGVFAKEGVELSPPSEALLSAVLPLGAAGCISATAYVKPGNIAQLCERWQDEHASSLREMMTHMRKTVRSLSDDSPKVAEQWRSRRCQLAESETKRRQV
ncbi:dihydrodipicolinate synthase family protein [Paraburkholderia sp. BL6669N2]|uniref:dihydrodipicolinate synthase family protein n=1 Tax=Paraburkholderia sp. BL6669N2 TaxID=1938807 RepID=UPI000E229FDC|nr:dihydrodipicolinate synthase family protein [Paraburkholderia sp. BL6669N2]